MKKIVFGGLIITLLFLSGCTTDPSTVEEKMCGSFGQIVSGFGESASASYDFAYCGTVSETAFFLDRGLDNKFHEAINDPEVDTSSVTVRITNAQILDGYIVDFDKIEVIEDCSKC